MGELRRLLRQVGHPEMLCIKLWGKRGPLARTILANIRQNTENRKREWVGDTSEGMPMEKETKDILEQFKNKLVMVVGGTTDSSSVHMELSKCVHFDLQQFYKRSKEFENPTGMSLRDTVFMEFGYDCQGTRPHSCLIDAAVTKRLFDEGYCKRMGVTLNQEIGTTSNFSMVQ